MLQPSPRRDAALSTNGGHRPLKVTFCVYDKPGHVGGPVSWIVRLLPALRSMGIDCRCLILLHLGDTGPAVAALQGRGIDCKAVACHDRTEDRVRWILDRLDEDPPDVFVPNLVVAGYFAGRWARRGGVATVGVMHSDDEFYRALQHEFVFGPPSFRVSAVVCVSRLLSEEVSERVATEVIVRRIPCGVPIPELTVAQDRSTFRIAYAGRLANEQKRISDVARALCRAVREVPGTEAVIYGDGPDAEDAGEVLAHEGADLPVRMGGVIPAEGIQEKLAECDVFVLLSDYEGLPIALMEAMACGCVPVCLRIRSGIPELVDDGVNGLLVDDRADGFVNAIRRLRDDPELKQRLSAAARATIVASYTEAQSAESWKTLLEDLRSTGKPRARGAMSPARIRLPPVNPLLESAELRRSRPSFLRRTYGRGRMFAGRLRRVLLRRPPY